jgi:hypothetical protein
MSIIYLVDEVTTETAWGLELTVLLEPFMTG